MKLSRLTFLTCFGAGFEYYDFVVYAMLAPWLSRVFFPQPQHFLHIIQVLAIFASGYLVRPCGGMFFARLGDILGRKKVYCIVVALMSVSTLGIALLPGYQQIGIAAPVLLLGLRLLQGASLGAELPGALILLAEHAPPNRRGLLCGLQISCIGLGAALATFFCGFVQHHLTLVNMKSFGWRLPFLLGAFLAVVAGIARSRVSESPIFLKAQKQALHHINSNLFIWQYRALIAQGIGMLTLPASLVMTVLSLPVWFRFLGYQPLIISHAMSSGYLWCSLLIPLFALLADKFGRRRTIKLSCCAGAVFFCFGMLAINYYHSSFAIFGLIFGLQTWQASLSACYFTRLAELFPTAIRFRGYAFCYNIVYAVCGMIPMLIAWRMTKPNFIVFLSCFFVLLAFFCWRSVAKGKELAGLNLESLG